MDRLIGSAVAPKELTDAEAALGHLRYLLDEIDEERRKLAEREEAIKAAVGFIERAVCPRCWGAGGFNTRDEFGWTGKVNPCTACKGTGRPADFETAGMDAK